MLTLYGIKNCDTVKKARRWLESQGKEYLFHDFREDGLDEQQLSEWIKNSGWETFVNKRSTTWRKLSEKEKQIHTNQEALSLLLKNPTLIKRPVVLNNKQLLVGFNEAEFKKL